MEIYQYFVSYQFEDLHLTASRSCRGQMIHGEVILEFSLPIRTTADIHGVLRPKLIAHIHNMWKLGWYPADDEIKIESLSLWESSDTKAYDKWQIRRDAEQDLREHKGVPWWKRPKRKVTIEEQ